MFSWVSKAALPEPGAIEWIFDVYEWLLQETGGMAELVETPLVLPTDEFFPVPSGLCGHDLAVAMFEHVREHARLTEWPVRFSAHGEGPRLTELIGRVPHGDGGHSGAAGTFAVTEDRVVEITYSPSTISDPIKFVATMAHELAHYLILALPVPPPGGHEAEEPATDICAVFIGLGVFSANAAFTFNQFTDGEMVGWQASSLGYVGERTIAYALAVFLELRAMDSKEAARHLDANPRTYLKHALRDIRRNRSARMERLRGVLGAQVS